MASEEAVVTVRLPPDLAAQLHGLAQGRPLDVVILSELRRALSGLGGDGRGLQRDESAALHLTSPVS